MFHSQVQPLPWNAFIDPHPEPAYKGRVVPFKKLTKQKDHFLNTNKEHLEQYDIRVENGEITEGTVQFWKEQYDALKPTKPTPPAPATPGKPRPIPEPERSAKHVFEALEKAQLLHEAKAKAFKEVATQRQKDRATAKAKAEADAAAKAEEEAKKAAEAKK